MKKIFEFFFKKPIGQFIGLGLICVAAAYFGRLYYVDYPTHQATEEAKSGAERLEEMASMLDDALSAAEDRQAFVAGLPPLTSWNPVEIACGGYEGEFHGDLPIWKTLGIESGKKTRFQYRFEKSDLGFVLRARRDVDCDGIYVVHTLEGVTNWSSSLRDYEVITQNSAE